MKKKLSLIIYCLVLITLISGLYFSLTKTFYQQDEWFGYGLYLANYTGTIWQSTDGLASIILGQGRILTNLLLFLFYKYFPLNVYPIAIFAIGFHIINTLIVFFLARKIFKNHLSAFLGSLFFAVNSVSQSAITWPAASINTLPSTTLILIALIFYFRYLESFRQKWLGLSFIFVYASLFFKETGVFLLLLLPLFTLVYKKQNSLEFIKRYWYYFVTVFLIVVFRLLGFMSESSQVALFLTGSSKYFFDSLMVRSILYPLTSFSLSIIPPDIFLNFARYMTNVYYPFIPEVQFILVAQTVVLDFLSIIFSSIIVIISVILYKNSDIKIRKQMVFWFVFLLASFLPYIIISKSYSYLESRYYYVSNIAWSMIFAWLFYILIEIVKKRILYIYFILIYIIFIFIHIKTVKTDLNRLVNESQTRISILNQISLIKPKITENKNIFYVTGDTDYYLVGHKVPFQQGFGYTLLTLYFDKSQYPVNFLNNTDLFEIGKEGYFEKNGFGFGYFSDIINMEETLKVNGLSKETVIALYYNSNENKINQIILK